MGHFCQTEEMSCHGSDEACGVHVTSERLKATALAMFKSMCTKLAIYAKNGVG